MKMNFGRKIKGGEPEHEKRSSLASRITYERKRTRRPSKEKVGVSPNLRIARQEENSRKSDKRDPAGGSGDIPSLQKDSRHLSQSRL